jgi:Bifunctional DNA primase/polymerase, N-terminal
MLHATASADVAAAAVAFAKQGIPVFPCVPGGKQPLTTRGFHDASADLARVREWWSRTPEANVGLPTGRASGVLVVDVDVHAAGSGYAAFERARAAQLTDGWGWLVRTPSGGLHAYYPPAHGGEQRSWQVPREHVDFRGDGGYIVTPPSRVVGADGVPRPYQVIAVGQHRPRALDAARLRAFLDPPKPTGPPASMPAAGTRPDKLATWVASRPEGARNHGLFWAACRMAEDGHRFDATLATLGDAARTAGLPEREAETTIRSAYRIASRQVPMNDRVTGPVAGRVNGRGPARTVEAVAM